MLVPLPLLCALGIRINLSIWIEPVNWYLIIIKALDILSQWAEVLDIVGLDIMELDILGQWAEVLDIVGL